jgi:2-hydroxy-3-keto-5-methylthiopentenyl-1-phosphate phosphatase
MRSGWAVVCDFDGTTTTEDIGDRVSIAFGGYDAWRAAEDDFARGGMPFSVLLERIFAPVRASRDEIAAFAREHAVLRPGFDRFVAACREADVPFVVCSAGLDVYIEAVLERLPPPLRQHVQLRCNHGTCSPQGLKLEFHRSGEDCGDCGFCKGAVVKQLRRAGRRVAVIGDGNADRCPAKVADQVFARGRLAAWCRAERVPHAEFEDFDEVLRQFPR